MKDPNIAKVLKESRKKCNLTIADVVSTLKECSIDVADKTVYGWENGRAQPDLASLLVLCDLYHIHNILDKFGYTASSSGDLSTEERLIMEVPRRSWKRVVQESDFFYREKLSKNTQVRLR